MQTFSPEQQRSQQPGSSTSFNPVRDHCFFRPVTPVLLKHSVGDQPEQPMLKSPLGESKGEQAATTSSLLNQVNPHSKTFFQAKLAINMPGDRYEQEADRAADQVMRMPELT